MGYTVKVQGQSYELTDDQKNAMEYIKETEVIEKQDSIEITTINKAVWEEILHLFKLVNGKFPVPPKVKTNDVKDLIDNAALAEHLNGKNPTQINDLYRAAHFLKIKDLRRCIAAAMAARVYVKPTLTDYQNRKTALGVKKELTADISKKMKETYPFMN